MESLFCFEISQKGFLENGDITIKKPIKVLQMLFALISFLWLKMIQILKQAADVMFKIFTRPYSRLQVLWICQCGSRLVFEAVESLVSYFAVIYQMNCPHGVLAENYMGNPPNSCIRITDNKIQSLDESDQSNTEIFQYLYQTIQTEVKNNSKKFR